MGALKIGDKVVESENRQIEVIDEDRLCYLVKNVTKGAYGIRTISKALLKEFVQYVKQHPSTSPKEARTALSGKSEIDRFEYGYDSTFVALAKMVLERYPNGEYDVSMNKTQTANELQQIFYGAPGTGKSYKIKNILEQNKVPEENVFRTTFHPDSDYSTFVGAYKPTMEKKKDKVYNKEELINKLTEIKESGTSYPTHKFAAKYWRSLKQLKINDKKDILKACDLSENFTVEFDMGTALGEEYLAGSEESRIVYSFVPQAFLNAYVRAYQTEDNVYLVIEEINRGNCAQIFGDLFQLLDRNEEGKSEYKIKADADLKSYLEEVLGYDNEGIKDGELCLPPNLYIYATMNTSDQSLFPIDSAFKRRWDWVYEPIKYKNIDWKIDIQGKQYSWVSFQKIINKKILDATNSEDKMLGDYFVNPKGGIITERMLSNKIMFYLWNDVCKDGEGDIFKTSDTDYVSFSELHGDESSQKLVAMMDCLGVDKIKDDVQQDDEAKDILEENATEAE